jgi:hypothetical protein
LVLRTHVLAPLDLAAPACLAMSYLYKRCNRLWPVLIRSNLTALAWRPLIELSRLGQLRFRRRLEARAAPAVGGRPGMVLADGV